MHLYIHMCIKSSLIKQSAIAYLHLASVKRKINVRFVAGNAIYSLRSVSHLDGERFCSLYPTNLSPHWFEIGRMGE